VTDPQPLRRPALIEVDGDADPGVAAPVADVASTFEGALRLTARRPSFLSRFAGWAFATFLGFVLTVAAWDFVTGLLARDSILGWIAFAVTGAAILAAVLLALREVAGFVRLRRLDVLRAGVLAAADPLQARKVMADVAALYARRSDMALAQAQLANHTHEMLDADALLAATETALMGPLDQAARREIEGAARQVALVTALVPLALADVAMALWANLRMVRRMADIYGGRSGGLASLRLMRRVLGHLVATGALALTDDLIGSVAGGGLLSKISRRFGEGVVNAALTARVGIAAMEVCRPMPFAALPKPKVTNLVSRALAGVLRMPGASAPPEER
jgi:putative membrane protein